jgi:hypothetical protein
VILILSWPSDGAPTIDDIVPSPEKASWRWYVIRQLKLSLAELSKRYELSYMTDAAVAVASSRGFFKRKRFTEVGFSGATLRCLFAYVAVLLGTQTW